MAEQMTYFITGGAGGIGRYIVDGLLARGDRVYAADLNVEALRACAKESRWPEDRVRLDALDVRSHDAWREVFGRAVEAFGRIDVCMNIAGVLLPDWGHEATDDDINLQIDANLKGVIWGTQTAAVHMLENGAGHIVNIASVAGVAAIPGMSAYSASKFGVRGYSLAVNQEFRPRGVAVTTVCPDTVKTPLLGPSMTNEAGALLFSGSRLLTVEEVGRVVFERVLPDRPIEVVFPWKRAWLCRLANLFPSFTTVLLPGLRKKGLKNQQATRQSISTGRSTK